MQRRTRSQTGTELQRTRSKTDSHRTARGLDGNRKKKAQQPPASAKRQPEQSTTTPKTAKPQQTKNNKKRKEAPASIDTILAKVKAARGNGTKKYGNRIDIYKDTARWNARSISPYSNHVEIFYVGMSEHFELDDEQMVMIPEDEDEYDECLRHFNSFSDRVGKEQFLADLEVLVANDLVDDMAVLLNKSKDDARTQDTRDLKQPSLRYLLKFLSKTEFAPPIDPAALKTSSRGLKHQDIARVLIPAQDVEKFDEDPQAYADKVENGKIKSTEQDVGLVFYEDGKFDKDDPEFGLFRSDYFVLVWKLLFMGPSAAACHGLEHAPDVAPAKSGKAAEHGMTEATKESIVYAIVQGHFAISSCRDWRTGANGVHHSDLWTLSMRFLSDPDFLKALLKWWNTEGLHGASFKKKKHTKKAANPKEIEVIPNSTLDMIEVKRKRKAQARPAFLAAAECGAGITGTFPLDDNGDILVQAPGKAIDGAEDPPLTSSSIINNDEETPAADTTDDGDDIFANTTDATQFVPGTPQGLSNATSAADARTQEDSVTESDSDEERPQPLKPPKKYRKSAATQIINDDNDDSNDDEEEAQPDPKGKKPSALKRRGA
ncbi:hypothetical protein V5O48_012721 [Marasmius crinis-equi]|uniref:Uncharacterized protein n=1 Tax=Marasmius crinis-equi TaxID=585013 RepID=A0ABR3F2K6_9AGAR